MYFVFMPSDPPAAKTYAAPKGTKVRRAEPLPEKPKSNAYLEAAINTAGREQLLIMLLDGAIRFTTAGLDALKASKPAGEPLQRAQKIVAELMSGLKPEIGAQLYEKLMGLYRFCVERLMRAGMQRETGAADEALRVLNDLRTLWADAIATMNAEGRPEELGHVPTHRVNGLG